MTTIRPAAERDLALCARTASRAFVVDPVMRWFFPGDDEYDQLSIPTLTHLVRRWHAAGTLWCTDDGVAMAGWFPPGRPEVDVGDGPEIDHPQWRLDRFMAIGVAMEEHTPREPHWYLNMLATHPDWQRQGLGGALMGEVFAVADEQALPCYLETETVENVAYYRHHGFDVRSEWSLEAGGEPGPHMWGMLRPPRS